MCAAVLDAPGPPSAHTDMEQNRANGKLVVTT